MTFINHSLAAKNVLKFINGTNQHIFLTGKAGTGKTTLLKQIVETTHKKTIIAAPTGIAAINAGGVTLHSLFHLPFGTFYPSNQINASEINIQLTTPSKLLKELRMNNSKRDLIREMELLIIDEVSMLRADLLDAIDTTLRHIKRNKQAFGGIQILFIGDLWQLPPVVKDYEWKFLNSFYKSIYFFNALAFNGNPPIYIELDKIFRQSDRDFIELLNHFRINQFDESDIHLLNNYYKPEFNLLENEGYIYLTTHNHKADAINTKALDLLKGETFSFDAMVEGDFSEQNYPLEYTLQLKEGAQVMFIKNDYSGNSAYFNGKIGTVETLSEDYIEVAFSDGSPSAIVEPYKWENKKFSLNKVSHEIEERTVGTFTHFPIKLAWAITVHKSQGLTFEHAVIDISQAFAAGQTYVALSRLTSLNGLVLASKLPDKLPEIDLELSNFAKKRAKQEELNLAYKEASQAYINARALEAFDLSFLKSALKEHLESYDKDEKKSAKQKHHQWAKTLFERIVEVKKIAGKFQHQIERIIRSKDKEYIATLNVRVLAAKDYFIPIFNKEIDTIKEHVQKIKNEIGVKKYLSELNDISGLFYRQIFTICKIEGLCNAVINNTELDKQSIQQISETIRIQNKPDEKELEPKSKKSKTKKNKPHTSDLSFELYQQGKSIKEIAKERALSKNTIEKHMSICIEDGRIQIKDFLSTEQIEIISKVIKESDYKKLSQLKEALNNQFAYSEIQYVLAHLKRKSNL